LVKSVSSEENSVFTSVPGLSTDDDAKLGNYHGKKLFIPLDLQRKLVPAGFA
jgi:hypothetical protein